jgi:hypothetical protein
MSRRLFIFAVIFLFQLALPYTAHAQALGGFTIDTCAPGNPWDYTVKVVACVENSVQNAVFTMMNALSAYMTPVLGAMLTIATAVFGMRVMAGERQLLAKAQTFAIRVVFVMIFAVNLGGYAGDVFSIETGMINMVAGGSPWVTIDTFVGQLLGSGPPPLDISKGLIGIIGAGLLSSTPLGIMAFIALSAVINILLFIFRVVFTYLTALVMIGFLIAISPLVIPMALFVPHTERFFSKWLDILISAMLTPVLLFAFLSVFLAPFQSITQDVITILQCGNSPAPAGCDTAAGSLNFKMFQKMNGLPGSLLVTTDPTFAGKVKNVTGNKEVGKPAIQTNMYPSARRAHEVDPLTKPGLDFGPVAAQATQKLIYALLALWIFASFMKSLIERIPDLATNIAEASSYITMAPSSAERMFEKGGRNLQTALTGRR